MLNIALGYVARFLSTRGYWKVRKKLPLQMSRDFHSITKLPVHVSFYDVCQPYSSSVYCYW